MPNRTRFGITLYGDPNDERNGNTLRARSRRFGVRSRSLWLPVLQLWQRLPLRVALRLKYVPILSSAPTTP